MNPEKSSSMHKPPRLKKELEHIFLPIIRSRGKKYAKSGRVRINKLEPNLISSTVRGTINYAVTVSLENDGSGRVRIGCTCPFFRQGIPCKHIWATICRADQLLAEMPSDKKGPKGPVMDADRLFREDMWRCGRAKQPWKPVQDFVIRYRLEIEGPSISAGVFEQYIKKDGNPGRTRRITSKAIERPVLPRQDRLLLPFLKDLAEKSAFYSMGFFRENLLDLENIPLRPEEAGVIIPMLAETKRCQVILDGAGEIADPLRLAPVPDARLEISASPQGRNKVAFKAGIIIQLDSQEERIGLDQILFLNSDPVLFILNGLLFQLEGPSYSWLEQAAKQGLPSIKKRHLPRVVKDAWTVAGGEVLQLPEELSPKKVKGERPELHLTLELTGSSITAVPSLEYKGHRVEPHSEDPLICDYDKWEILKRDLDEEKRLLGLFQDSGFKPDQSGKIFELPIEKAQEALGILESKGVILETADNRRFHTGSIKTFSITSGIDWFDMDAEVSFGDETVPLPQVVRAYLKGEKTIRLRSGGQGILPASWLNRHSHALELAQKGKKGRKKDTLRFAVSHTLLIDQMLQEASEVQVDSSFARRRERIRAFRGIKPRRKPEGFKGRLRKYQEEALGWFHFLEELGLGGILADDMGLGKTVQVLAWLLEKRQENNQTPSLVVAPTSLVFNWQSEAARFTPDLEIKTFIGARRHENMEDCLKADLVLTTYGILRRDIAGLSKVRFRYAVLDESQCIKNPDSAVSKAVRLIQADHKLCLTGTPLENHVGELWSQMEFLNPGMLGPKDRFMKRFAKPLAHGEKTVLSTLKQLVKPFILRRTKEEVASELPGKQEMVIRCHMTRKQEELYLKVRDHYRAAILETVSKKGIKRSKIKVLEGLLRLRQAANHPALVGAEDVDSGKFLQLMDLLGETVEGGHKALVFSQFTRMLGIIKRDLLERGISFEYLDGRTPQSRREEKVINFQENQDVKLFLISLRAGGIGLNLTAADYVFIVDPWWNPAVELQAVDRTHRIGQTRKVVTYRLISKNTVEEKVLKLQKKKQEIVGSILSGSRNMLSSLTAEDLEILFS